MACSCIVHLYHIFHITPNGWVWSNSANSCQALAEYERRTGERAVTLPIRYYRHDLTKEEAIDLYKKFRDKCP
jgi:hypothetical protein